MNKPVVFLPIDLPTEHVQLLAQHFELLHVPEGPQWHRHIPAVGDRAVALLTRGSIGLSADQLAGLPHLRLVCCMGAGFENVDLEAARARGVEVTSNAGSNSACVADHAMGLVLAAMRLIPRLDRDTREGRWQAQAGMPPQVSGKTLGILGLGAIGLELARRASGFSMPILYCNRRPRADVPWPHVTDAVSLAAQVDVLVATLPGGQETRHLVDEKVFSALGPGGYFVNVGRGSVVRTDHLVAALESGTLAGAGLDVFETEPALDPRLCALDNVVLSPHVAGRSPEARLALVQGACAKLLAHFKLAPAEEAIT